MITIDQCDEYDDDVDDDDNTNNDKKNDNDNDKDNNARSKILCHGLLTVTSFVDNVPLDTAFITDMNEKNFLVVHNFRRMKYNSSSLLRDIIY